METQAEYKTSKPESYMPMHAYVVLHLVSQGYTNFVEMRKVLCRESAGSYYITILEYIFSKINALAEEWARRSPQLQLSCSTRTAVRASGFVSISPVMVKSSQPCNKSQNLLRQSLPMTSGTRY